MSLNPALTYTKNGKRVIRCRKTRKGDWNYLSLDAYGFLHACVIGVHPWAPVQINRIFHDLKVCYSKCTNLECLK